jgi:hypothetical protein
VLWVLTRKRSRPADEAEAHQCWFQTIVQSSTADITATSEKRLSGVPTDRRETAIHRLRGKHARKAAPKFPPGAAFSGAF